MTKQNKSGQNKNIKNSIEQQIISISSYSNTDSYIMKLDEATSIFALSVYLLDYDGITDSFYILGGCAGCSPDEIDTMFRDYIIKVQQHHLNQEGVADTWGFKGQIQSHDDSSKNNTETKSSNTKRSANWMLSDGTGYNKLLATVSVIEKRVGERLSPEFFTGYDADSVKHFFSRREISNPF
jgi:hypothetical protein